MKLTWYDGRLLPPIPPELEPDRKLPGSGALLIGDKGTILHGSHGADGVRLIPETRMRDYTRPAKTIRRVTEGARRRLDPRVQGRTERDASVLDVRIRRGADGDGASWRARDPDEGSAAGLGQRESQIHQQREGERAAQDSVPGRVDSLTPNGQGLGS